MSDTHPHRRGTDQIFEGVTWGRIAKISGAIMGLGTIAIAVISTIVFFLATKPELKTVADSLASANKRDEIRDQRIEERFRRLEARQDTVSASVRLIPAMARLQCIELERANSRTLGRAARLPCDTL
jgi:hypothetical protein